MKKTYNLIKEPKDKVYKDLLHFSLKYCDTFQLVVQHHMQNNVGVQGVISIFKPFLRSVTEESEWPGTVLHKGTATVYLFRVNEKSISLLGDLVDGLYDWVQPNFPEDLCIRRKDNTPWLSSITYENDAYLDLTIEEKNELHASIPGLSLEENNKIIN